MWCWVMRYGSNQMQMLGVVSESLPGAVEGALNKDPGALFTGSLGL